MYLNTNTVFCILKIHKIHVKLAIQWSNTKNDNYKDKYITFTVSHFADAFIQSDLQLGNT